MGNAMALPTEAPSEIQKKRNLKQTWGPALNWWGTSPKFISCVSIYIYEIEVDFCVLIAKMPMAFIYSHINANRLQTIKMYFEKYCML